MPGPSSANRLDAAVTAAVPQLTAIRAVESARRPAPDKWCPREIIGHLIDSAGNNHQRFVRAVGRDDLVFDGYAQDRWVELQRYREAPWDELVTLWASFNRHLARVMAAIPEVERLRERSPHNLDRLAWRPVPAATPATLDYFMTDYVDHLEHHLRQILGPRFRA